MEDIKTNEREYTVMDVLSRKFEMMQAGEAGLKPTQDPLDFAGEAVKALKKGAYVRTHDVCFRLPAEIDYVSIFLRLQDLRPEVLGRVVIGTIIRKNAYVALNRREIKHDSFFMYDHENTMRELETSIRARG